MAFFPDMKNDGITPAFSLEEVEGAAFEYFSTSGFPYHNLMKHVCMQQINELRKMSGSALLHSPIAMRVADTYHPHRFHAVVFGAKGLPVDVIRDEKKLTRAIRLRLKYFGKIGSEYFSELGLVSGIQTCSNFRPAFALDIYRKYGKLGGTVLDTCFGFGGRLVGFIASDCRRYIGFDPSTKSYESNLRMSKDLAKDKEVLLRCLPIEDADLSEFEESSDVAFTSPPYFCKEVYSEEDTQSCYRYKMSRDWCNGFLVPMMRFQFSSLKPGCYALVNIADVKIKNKLYPLVRWTIKAGEMVGFTYEGNIPYALSRRFGSGKKGGNVVSVEPVLKFRKDGSNPTR